MNHQITLEVAEKMIHAREPKPRNKNIGRYRGVDASGKSQGVVRMDGAWLGSIDIAIRKARTAVIDMDTAENRKMSQRASPLRGRNTAMAV